MKFEIEKGRLIEIFGAIDEGLVRANPDGMEIVLIEGGGALMLYERLAPGYFLKYEATEDEKYGVRMKEIATNVKRFDGEKVTVEITPERTTVKGKSDVFTIANPETPEYPKFELVETDGYLVPSFAVGDPHTPIELPLDIPKAERLTFKSEGGFLKIIVTTEISEYSKNLSPINAKVETTIAYDYWNKGEKFIPEPKGRLYLGTGKPVIMTSKRENGKFLYAIAPIVE